MKPKFIIIGTVKSGTTTLREIHQRIVDSLIGRRAKPERAPHRPKALRFMVGDDSHIEIV